MSVIGILMDGPGRGRLWTLQVDASGDPPARIEDDVATYDREGQPASGTLWQYRYRANGCTACGGSCYCHCTCPTMRD